MTLRSSHCPLQSGAPGAARCAVLATLPGAGPQGLPPRRRLPTEWNRTGRAHPRPPPI